MRFEMVDVGSARLNVAMTGDPANPLIICLHGFPEYWAGWAGVMERLADRFFVVAPDQRGYNLSSRPEGVAAYRLKHLVQDLAGLADQLSPDRSFVLAGHDWGSSVAYGYAFTHPQRLSHLVIANGIHPWCFQQAIIEDDEQRRASQYMNVLKSPQAEARLSEDGYRRLLRMIEGFSPVPFMTDAMRAAYVEAWSQPGALTAMLDWYRASPVEVPEPGAPAGRPLILDMAPERFAVSMPHLLLWGEADQALRPACMSGLGRFARRLTVERFADAGHWILHEKPDVVAASIRRFLA